MSFLKFCYTAQYLPRIPQVPRVTVDEPETMPLSKADYKQLLQHCDAPRLRALVQLMRWSGLSTRDAITLKRGELIFDKGKKIYRIVTARQKTGTGVSVPIPAEVAQELLTVLNGNPVYVFWSGNGEEDSAVRNMQKAMLALFKKAGLKDEGHMVSHRLRDTFAVDLLEKGVPMEEVSKLLGHTSILTTERHYAK